MSGRGGRRSARREAEPRDAASLSVSRESARPARTGDRSSVTVSTRSRLSTLEKQFEFRLFEREGT